MNSSRDHSRVQSERPKHETPKVKPAAPQSPVMDSLGATFEGMGNRALLSLLHSGRLERKARISQPGDAREREADRAANAVVSGSRSVRMPRAQAAPTDVQRTPTEEQQLAAALGLGPAGPPVHEVPPPEAPGALVAGQLYGGRPLDETTRGLMESRFGENFSDVRIYTGHRAAEAADSVQAHAFTVGENIVFAEGQFAPETTEGQRLLAHELAHVVQQRQPAGPVAREQESERDAREAAREVAGGGTPSVRERALPGTVQKQEPEETKWVPVPIRPSRFGPDSPDVIFVARDPETQSPETVASISNTDGPAPRVSDAGAYEHGGTSGHDILTITVGVLGPLTKKTTSPTARWHNIELQIYQASPLPPEPQPPEPVPVPPAPKTPIPPAPTKPAPPPKKTEPPTSPPVEPPKSDQQQDKPEKPDWFPQKLERLRRHMDEGRWDVDDYAQKLTNAEMSRLPVEDRFRILKYVAEGLIVDDDDEDTIIRLIETTPDEDAEALVDKLKDNPGLMKTLHDAIDGEENLKFHEAMRKLYLRSMTDPARALDRMNKATHTVFLDPPVLTSYKTGHTRYEIDFSGDKIHFQSWWIPQVPIMEFPLNPKTDLDPFDMVAVHFESGEEFFGGRQGTVVYMPAYSLLKLDNKQFHHNLEVGANTVMIVGGGAGMVGAGTRAAFALAALETAVGAGSFIVEAVKDDLAKTPEGRAFLKAWQIANALIGVYSLGKVVVKAPQALRSVRDAYQAFKGAGGLAKLDPAEAAKLESEMQKLATRIDEAEKATAGAPSTGETVPDPPGAPPTVKPPEQIIPEPPAGPTGKDPAPAWADDPTPPSDVTKEPPTTPPPSTAAPPTTAPTTAPPTTAPGTTPPTTAPTTVPPAKAVVPAATPLSEADAVAESRKAYERAEAARNALPAESRWRNKVVASDGTKTISTYHDTPPGQNYDRVTPHDVAEEAKKIEHTLRPAGGPDMKSMGGFDGAWSASHAEKQLLMLRPGHPIGIAGRRMCPDCVAFFQKWADMKKVTLVATDTEGTKIFTPGGGGYKLVK
jgi:hypothetical protein